MNYANEAQAPREAGPADMAERVLQDAANIHSMLDDLEIRLFGPEPRAVGTMAGAKGPDGLRPSLAHMLRDGSVATSSAIGRLSTILNRL